MDFFQTFLLRICIHGKTLLFGPKKKCSVYKVNMCTYIYTSSILSSTFCLLIAPYQVIGNCFSSIDLSSTKHLSSRGKHLAR